LQANYLTPNDSSKEGSQPSNSLQIETSPSPQPLGFIQLVLAYLNTSVSCIDLHKRSVLEWLFNYGS
jgi:hypothetical protein